MFQISERHAIKAPTKQQFASYFSCESILNMGSVPSMLKCSKIWTLLCVGIALWASASAVGADTLRVASLNPILSSLLRDLGASRLEVIDLVPSGGDPHSYRPSPLDMKRMAESAAVFACGREMEPYLPALRENLAPVPVIEVSRVLPPVHFHAGQACTVHDHGEQDPHWWHSPRSVIRVCRFITHSLTRLSEEDSEHYRQAFERFRDRLETLDQEIREQLHPIPKDRRILATAHAAFNYFCHDYHFTAVPIQGLTREQMPGPRAMQELIDLIERRNIPAVFPEKNANPKILESLVQETDAVIGPFLYADTVPEEAPRYEAMMRHNADVIVRTLTPRVP